MKRTNTCLAVLLVVLVALDLPRSAAIVLVVDYPLGNYRVASLTCYGNVFQDPLTPEQRSAVFLRDGLGIDSDSVVSVEEMTDTSISFVFNRSQEGGFSCRTADNQDSNVVYLAAPPSVNYDDAKEDRYFIIQSANVAVNLSCPIQPGVLKERYSVTWTRVTPDLTVTPLGATTFDISESVPPKQPAMFKCRVTIVHVVGSPPRDQDYDGPEVRVHTKVLSVLSNVVSPAAPVTLGDRATLYCNVLKQDTDFSISWRIASDEYTCDGSHDADHTNFHCSVNATHSVLQIQYSTTLGARSHRVQCIMRQIFPQVFIEDPSFLPMFSADITRETTLVILNKPFVATGDLRLTIDYSSADSMSFSSMKLSCQNNSGAELPSPSALFKLNGTEITTEENVQHISRIPNTNNVSLVVFNQEQEGVLSCEYETEIVAVEFAASPPDKGSNADRYFILPSADTAVNLSCAIRPGALANKYSVRWTRQISSRAPILMNETTFNISVFVPPREPKRFACHVTIEYLTFNNEVLLQGLYDVPQVTVHTKVLSTLSADGDFGYVTVIIGEPAKFACSIVGGDTDFNIVWKIAGFEYFCDEHEVDPNIKCNVNSNTSLLQIENTDFLGIGNHKIQCVLQPDIHPNYTNDPSFISQFRENITNTGTLELLHSDSTTAIETITTTVATSGVTLVVCTTVMLILIVLLKKRNRRRKGDHIFEGELATTRPLPELPPSPSPPPPVDLVHQLQKELVLKNMLYLKHQLHLSKVIGEGESGLVYRGYINGNELVAVKTGKALLSGSNKERLLKEVTLMLSFDHPNVMSLIGMCFDGEVPLLIMPFMSGGSVLNYVTQNRENLHFTDESLENEVSNARKKCLGMCHQIAKGMSYLAMKRFIHRDLAARNCMIDMTGNGVIKVADFGLAEDIYTRNYYCHNRSEGGERVPIRWMAPESIDTNIYNETTDVWSFGVTCWEVFTCGRVPYTGLPAMTLLSELHSGHRLERPSNVACSDQIWKMIGLCWLQDPQQRPKFTELTSKLLNILDSDSSYLRL